jgi:hypothetical protein
VRRFAGWVVLAGSVLALVVPATCALAWGAAPAGAAVGRAGAAARAKGMAASAGTRHVVIVGIGGLRWSDVSPATPVLWRTAEQGSVGSLDVSGIEPRTCPADGWLTLNAGARAGLPHPASGPCPAGPPVVSHSPSVPPATPVPARVPDLGRLESYNVQFHWAPRWGLLASAPGPGRCATAAGPGAALALAHAQGEVPSYLAAPSELSPAVLDRCPLTVIDLGSLPSGGGPAGNAARAAAVHAADAELAVIRADLPLGSTLVVVGAGDGPAPHLHVIMVSGPGFRAGLLDSASTRQAGLVLLTDLTPTVLGWSGTPVPSTAVGSPLVSVGRGSLPATIRMLIAQDTAAHVYQSTVMPFRLLVGFGYAALFGLIWVAPRGHGEKRSSRRRAVARAVGAWAAAVPAGTFLAGLVPWPMMAHPAAVLYSLTVVWAVVIAGIALAGPWRRDPLGPAGVVAATTAGVIALDMMTGTHLMRETPFGLDVLVTGRFYGLGNNAVVIYGASGILCAAWLGGATLRRGSRERALAVMAAAAVVTVVAVAWPGFGAKVGGTVAMVPGFLVLLAAAAGVKLTARRWALIAVSGVVLVVAFALVSYFAPTGGHSDIGGFVGQSLHGGAGDTLQRKISSNVGSLTANPFMFVIPVVLIALGTVVAWPARLRARLLVQAYERVPLLRAALSAVWLVGVLGWFAEDSGVTVPAAALPFVLPLVVVILSSVPRDARDPAGGDATAEPPPALRTSPAGLPGMPALPRGYRRLAR